MCLGYKEICVEAQFPENMMDSNKMTLNILEHEINVNISQCQFVWIGAFSLLNLSLAKYISSHLGASLPFNHIDFCYWAVLLENKLPDGSACCLFSVCCETKFIEITPALQKGRSKNQWFGVPVFYHHAHTCCYGWVNNYSPEGYFWVFSINN